MSLYHTNVWGPRHPPILSFGLQHFYGGMSRLLIDPLATIFWPIPEFRRQDE